MATIAPVPVRGHERVRYLELLELVLAVDALAVTGRMVDLGFQTLEAVEAYRLWLHRQIDAAVDLASAELCWAAQL